MEMGAETIFNPYFVQHGRSDVVLWDVFPLGAAKKFLVNFESVSSEWRQGLWLCTKGGLYINDTFCSSADLWFNHSPKEVFCECPRTDGKLSVYNIFHDGIRRKSQTATSGMLVEEIQSGRRYCCHSMGYNPTFKDLVFTIIRL